MTIAADLIPPVPNPEPNITGRQHLRLTDRGLHFNASLFPEMNADLDPVLVDEARSRLLELPLIHRTSAERLSSNPVEGHTLNDVPVPRSHLPRGHHSNTYAFDRREGLDEYTFMSWGAVFSRLRGGFLKGSRYAVLIDPKILMDRRCIATPHDVGEIISSRTLTEDRSHSVRLSPQDRRKAQERRLADGDSYMREYMFKAVYGSDWLEIQARRLVQRSVRERKSLDQLEISADDLGEIKFKGPIPQSAIIGSLDTFDKEEYELYEEFIRKAAGFILSKTTHIGRRLLR